MLLVFKLGHFLSMLELDVMNPSLESGLLFNNSFSCLCHLLNCALSTLWMNFNIWSYIWLLKNVCKFFIGETTCKYWFMDISTGPWTRSCKVLASRSSARIKELGPIKLWPSLVGFNGEQGSMLSLVLITTLNVPISTMKTRQIEY